MARDTFPNVTKADSLKIFSAAGTAWSAGAWIHPREPKSKDPWDPPQKWTAATDFVIQLLLFLNVNHFININILQLTQWPDRPAPASRPSVELRATTASGRMPTDAPSANVMIPAIK